ncbi:hypothetical protein FKR81_10695 [Lentzea tibetensis]|uniref:Membrane-associated oxidoreductase n=1 Tax=Lentzea tibetensis TaxID=2591470 RepID=A0A563EWF1_9PSEU|nr:hypothetical protein [Lentzea tibetensis]TWP52047.1 hypothetical protein FKR81_10695 [Lentzea tibetensis]
MSSKYGQELTALEQSLVDHVERGTPLDLLGDRSGPPGEAAMRSWGDDRTIRSWVIRDILLGRLAADPDPHGIDLHGCRITGRLDLMHVRTEVAVRFTHCLLPEGVDVRYARLGPVGLTHCRIEHRTLTAFNALQLSAPMLDLSDTTIVNSSPVAALHLLEAQIGGVLELDRSKLRNDSGPAICADAIQVGGALLMRQAVAVGTSERGAVCLFNARVDGSAELDGTELRNSAGPALYAELAHVQGPLYLRLGFTATGSGTASAVNLRSTRLCAFACSGATMRSASGPALLLSGARIDGPLDCSGATFDSASGPGLVASHARIEGSMICNRGFTATGSGRSGAVSIVDARIGNALECDGAVLRNKTGPALDAEGVDIKGVLLLRNGFTAEGTGVRGAVSMIAASIGDTTEISGARIVNDQGPALVANLVKIGGVLVLDRGTRIAGTGQEGALQLIDSRIEDAVELLDAEVRDNGGPAVQMRQARVGQSMTFGARFRAVASNTRLTVGLSQVQIGTTLHITPACAEHLRSSGASLDVDGLTYVGLPRGISSAEWLEMLGSSTPWYAAQPYQQLAAAERAAGHDSGVRRVLMAQRRDQIESGALTGRGERSWAKVSGVTLGYGYQPWRALIALFLVLLMSALAAGFMGGLGGLQKVRTQANAPVESCHLVDRIGFGLDAGAPLITSGTRPKCETTSAAWGSALTISGWVLKVLAWAFATLFIAGFTGAVRKT